LRIADCGPSASLRVKLRIADFKLLITDHRSLTTDLKTHAKTQ
jgi:hypothetical protein